MTKTKITKLLKEQGWFDEDLRADPIGDANVNVVHIRLEDRGPRVDVLEPGRKHASAAERAARRVQVQKLLPAGTKIRVVEAGEAFEGVVEYSPEGMGYMRLSPNADFESPQALIALNAEIER